MRSCQCLRSEQCPILCSKQQASMLKRDWPGMGQEDCNRGVK